LTTFFLITKKKGWWTRCISTSEKFNFKEPLVLALQKSEDELELGKYLQLHIRMNLETFFKRF